MAAKSPRNRSQRPNVAAALSSNVQNNIRLAHDARNFVWGCTFLHKNGTITGGENPCPARLLTGKQPVFKLLTRTQIPDILRGQWLLRSALGRLGASERIECSNGVIGSLARRRSRGARIPHASRL